MSGLQVGIVMGSECDLVAMRPAADLLGELAIGHELRVMSAHDAPLEMLGYGCNAEDRGLSVLIAGASGSGHLAAMLAAVTPLPVIGVPLSPVAAAHLAPHGSPALGPGGVPVATVAVGDARQAGLLAARMLAIADPGVRERVRAAQASSRATARSEDHRVHLEFLPPQKV